jgi:hypothetical protein
MYLSRNITGITVANDNSKGTPGGGLPDVLPGIKGPGPDIIVSDNTTKLGWFAIDSYGVLKVTTSTGSSSVIIFLPTEKATAGVELVSISTTGAMAPVADGASGEFLKTNGSGVLSWSTAGGGGGWFGSTALMKVLPSEFMANDDGTNRDGFNGLYIEDDTSGKLGVRTSQSLTEMYVMKAIPTGYKATHVKVWASSTVSSGVTVYLYDHYTGDIITKGFGNTNVDINITDISSAARQDIAIRVAPGSNSILIYGVSITIAAI